jgi:hypothetical protein
VIPASTPYSGRRRFESIVVGLLLAALIVSFLQGWYWDHSTPPGGFGWFDQDLYTKAASQLGSFDLPSRDTFHYQMGYPLLGAIGYQVIASDPFMLVSLGLLLASATFGYLAVRAILGWHLAALFVVSLFAWDFVGRSFNSASELFVVPWNNQVPFFAVCFFFWVVAARVARAVPLTKGLTIAMGAITGVTIMTREEFALFLVPLLAFILWKLAASPAQWALCAGALVVMYLPQLILKAAVVGDVTSARGSRGYLERLTSYVDLKRLALNSIDVVFDSSFRGFDAGRKAILQATPWLWLAPFGLIAFVARRTESPPVKWFLIWSGIVFLFFLGGENVLLWKMRFHCVRYLTPGFPALHFGVVYSLKLAWEQVVRWRGTPDGGSSPTEGALPERAVDAAG